MNIYIEKTLLHKLEKYIGTPRLVNSSKIKVGFFVLKVNNKRAINYILDFKFRKLINILLCFLTLFILYFLDHVYNFTIIISILPIPYILLLASMIKGGYSIITLKAIDNIEKDDIVLLAYKSHPLIVDPPIRFDSVIPTW